MAPPLSGITVIDLTRVLAGPYCTMLLGDMGAEVIKIERPDGGDDTRGFGPPYLNGESAMFLAINRNKKSITLNLKQPEARAIFEKLIERADVLVENVRPGTMSKLGFDYEAVSRLNPRLIYCSISGFGQTGPYANRGGYDTIAQAMSGGPVRSRGRAVPRGGRARLQAVEHPVDGHAGDGDVRPERQRDARHEAMRLVRLQIEPRAVAEEQGEALADVREPDTALMLEA